MVGLRIFLEENISGLVVFLEVFLRNAHSFKSIIDQVSADLPRKVRLTKKEEIIELGFMRAGDAPRPTRYRSVSVEEDRSTKLIGIIFCHPKSPLAKSEIIDHLQYFHIRAGEPIDFYFMGYGAYWPPEHFPDQTSVVKIDGVEWFFSNNAFVEAIDEVEKELDWKHSGETELILLPAIKNKNGELNLDCSKAVVCNLEIMIKDKAITSVRAFFTEIFRFAKKYTEDNPTWELSDQLGIQVGKTAIKSSILNMLPKALKKSYETGEHFAVRDLRRS